MIGVFNEDQILGIIIAVIAVYMVNVKPSNQHLFQPGSRAMRMRLQPNVVVRLKRATHLLRHP